MTGPVRENYREDVAGRANVEDTPELLAYYSELEQLETAALWTVANKIEPWQPKSSSVPVLWRYRDLRDHVLRSVELVSPEKAGRRVIYLNNPGRRDVAAAVGWLYSGLQVMHPGEVASAHAHSASALRFIMEGAGAYTIVDGHKMTLGANDFVLTPNGTWHEHGVASEGTPCIWQDGLDIPLVNTLEANFYAVHPNMQQAVGYPVDDMTHTWGNPGLRPATGDWSKGYSPLLKYEWAPTYDALQRFAKATDGSPFDGILMNYVNPVDRRAGDADHRRRDAAAAPRRAHQGASAHRQFHLSGRQGERPLDHRRQALRLDRARHLLRALLGLARACECVRQRGCLPVHLQRPAGDAVARPLSGGSLRRQWRATAARGLRS